MRNMSKLQGVVMFLLVAGIVQQIIIKPSSFLVPILIAAVIAYFWKFPLRRSGGWAANNPWTRIREYRTYRAARLKTQKGKPAKKRPKPSHPFKVINGNKNNTKS